MKTEACTNIGHSQPLFLLDCKGGKAVVQRCAIVIGKFTAVQCRKYEIQSTSWKREVMEPVTQGPWWDQNLSRIETEQYSVNSEIFIFTQC